MGQQEAEENEGRDHHEVADDDHGRRGPAARALTGGPPFLELVLDPGGHRGMGNRGGGHAPVVAEPGRPKSWDL